MTDFSILPECTAEDRQMLKNLPPNSWNVKLTLTLCPRLWGQWGHFSADSDVLVSTVTVAMKLKDTWKKSYDKPGQHFKKQRHYFVNKGPYSRSYGFSSSHIRMWELDHKGGWALKNWCFQTVVLEKTLESPSESKEIKPVSPKGNQPWIFTGRTDAEAEAPTLWPPDVKSGLIGKDPDAGKDWRQEEKGVTEDEIVGWHHGFNGHEFEQTQILKDRGACCVVVHRVTKNWTKLKDWTTITVDGQKPWGLLHQEKPPRNLRARFFRIHHRVQGEPGTGRQAWGFVRGPYPRPFWEGPLWEAHFWVEEHLLGCLWLWTTRRTWHFQWKLWKPPRAFPCWSLRFKKGVNGDLQFPSRSGPVQ